MISLVRGCLLESDSEQRESAAQLLQLVGLPTSEALVRKLMSDHGVVEGSYRGIRCKLVCMDNSNTGEPELMKSVSFVFPLPEPTALALKLQNITSVRLGIAITQVEVDEKVQTVDPRLLLPEEASELAQLGVPHVLTLLPDRLTISTYRVYQAESYAPVLELLHRTYQRVVDMGRTG